LESPRIVTHTSPLASTSLAAAFSPRSRSALAPPIETVAKTAIAPVAASAIVRIRAAPERTSITASVGTGDFVARVR
jgi:hypothetical protein